MNRTKRFLPLAFVFYHLFSTHLLSADINKLYLKPDMEMNLGDGFNVETMTRSNCHSIFGYEKGKPKFHVSYSNRTQSYDYLYINDISDEKIRDQVVFDVVVEFRKNNSHSNSNRTQIVIYRKTTYAGTINTNSAELVLPEKYKDNEAFFEADYGHCYAKSAQFAQYIIAFIETVENARDKQERISQKVLSIMKKPEGQRQENDIDLFNENNQVIIRTKYIGLSNEKNQIENYTSLEQFNKGMKDINKNFSDDSGVILNISLASYGNLIDNKLLNQVNKSPDLLRFENIERHIFFRYHVAQYYYSMYMDFLSSLDFKGKEEFFVIPDCETIIVFTEKFTNHIKFLRKLRDDNIKIDKKDESAMLEFRQNNNLTNLSSFPPLIGNAEKYITMFLSPDKFKPLKLMIEDAEQPGLPEYILFIGNMGVGKTLILRSLTLEKDFKPGLLSNRTQRVTQVKNPREIESKQIFVDTPGLDNTKIEDRARQVRKVLLNNAKYRIFFVVRLDGKCINPDDIATVKIFINSIQQKDRGFNVIINNIPVEQKNKLESEGLRGWTDLNHIFDQPTQDIKHTILIEKNSYVDDETHFLQLDGKLRTSILDNSYGFTLLEENVEPIRIDEFQNTCEGYKIGYDTENKK